jgi:metal transporter CNNM
LGAFGYSDRALSLTNAFPNHTESKSAQPFLIPPHSPTARIIPQALSVRYGLAIGAACAPLVLGMMYLFSPIAYPIAKLLDWLLGKNETNTYKKAELKSFLQFHRTGEEPLRDDEITILNGVLELNTKDVQEIMTPLKDTVILSADTVLDHKAVDKMWVSSRISLV